MKTTKLVRVSDVEIGGGTRVKIQSMTTTKTADIEKTVAQITALKNAGCDIVRVAVADEEDALAIKSVKDKITLPNELGAKDDYGRRYSFFSKTCRDGDRKRRGQGAYKPREYRWRKANTACCRLYKSA